jgi:hypothetical protein
MLLYTFLGSIQFYSPKVDTVLGGKKLKFCIHLRRMLFKYHTPFAIPHAIRCITRLHSNTALTYTST